MSSLGDLMDTSRFFPSSASLIRLRAGTKPDPYNPDASIDDWSNPDILPFNGFIASSSSTEQPDGAREEAVSTAVLTVEGRDVDIRRGDRVQAVPSDGRTWRVTGFPATDRNPFTGWAPTLEATLEEVVG